MTQSTFTIANGAGATVRSNMNTAYQALATQSSGASGPSTPFAYQLWADTTNAVLKQRNSANTAWHIIGSLDAESVIGKTAAYTVVLKDFGKVIEADATSAAFTVTLPAVATAGDGFRITVKRKNSGSNAVTIDGAGSETIDGAATYVLSSQYESVSLRCDGVEWHVVAFKSEVSGIVLQSANGTIAAASGTSTIPRDNTDPVNTEGTEIWSQSITPGSAANKVEVEFMCNVSASVSGARVDIALFRGSTCIGVVEFTSSDTGVMWPVHFLTIDAPATTSAATYSARIGVSSGTWYVNQTSAALFNGNLAKTNYVLRELKG